MSLKTAMKSHLSVPFTGARQAQGVYCMHNGLEATWKVNQRVLIEGFPLLHLRCRTSLGGCIEFAACSPSMGSISQINVAATILNFLRQRLHYRLAIVKVYRLLSQQSLDKPGRTLRSLAFNGDRGRKLSSGDTRIDELLS